MVVHSSTAGAHTPDSRQLDSHAVGHGTGHGVGNGGDPGGAQLRERSEGRPGFGPLTSDMGRPVAVALPQRLSHGGNHASHSRQKREGAGQSPGKCEGIRPTDSLREAIGTGRDSQCREPGRQSHSNALTGPLVDEALQPVNLIVDRLPGAERFIKDDHVGIRARPEQATGQVLGGTKPPDQP